MNTLEDQICKAISILIDKAMSEARYDKTIQAVVIECVDSLTGKYKVRYQDSTFYAYSTNVETAYSDGSVVYVLIPCGDMSKDKTIIGTTEKLGVNYIPVMEDDMAYEINGNNCIINSSTFEMSSYSGTYAKILYHKDYLDYQNSIKVNKTAINEYIHNSTALICGAKFKTNLPQEQQYAGNYGIIFALDFLDNTSNNIVTRYYIVDIDKMVGNPYKMITETRQYGIYDIDSKNFSQVNYISIFCKDFPNTIPNKEADIFVSDIELNGASLLNSDDINSFSLSFITPQGTFFDGTSLDSDTRKIQAQIRIKGQILDKNSKNLSYYWFVEHVGITSQSIYYNKHGGQGWKCLNEYTVIGATDNSESNAVDWKSATYEWAVKKTDITAKEVKYKCAVVYEGTVVTRTIIIKNLTSSYDLEITSDLGTQFYFDIGFPTLTCKVNGKENKNYTYSWAVVNNAGNFQSIENTPDENRNYKNAYNQYMNLYNDIQNEVLPAAPNKTRLQQYKDALDAFDTITRVDGNVIYHLNVNTITLFSTYYCTVYYGDLYIGTTSIILYNSLQLEGVYSLVINNGSYVYKYNENGISPASSSIDEPISVLGLSFTIYDNLGQPIDDEIARHCSIKWIVPTINTLIKIPDSYTPVSTTDSTATYENLMTFNYLISDRYDITKDNNNIQLLVDYKGTSLAAITDFSFVKEGESGTNGTDFSCKIVPNVPTGISPPLYPTITELLNGNWSLNYTPVNSGKWFRVQLWHNELKILDGTSSANTIEGKEATVSWSILSNRYKNGVTDISSITLSNNGNFNFTGYRTDHPANIVKVTVVYNNVTYYATMPVYTVRISNTNYKVVLKDNSGFRYATYSADGKSPKYDNVNPFELIVTQNVGNNIYEDVSIKTSSKYSVDYNWNILGRLYENNLWIKDINLAERKDKVLNKNQKNLKPLDDFDGQCVTNALEGIISKNGNEIARIHMPIHLLLNKYGHSGINGWDGNSVNIQNDGGFILAPQVGAGIKEGDNSFTGVVIGKVKEANSSQEEVGLFGYSRGVRSIFLDAYTGKSQFGANGKAQIIIDPSSNKAQIYSGNYNTALKTGLMIDLTTPEIRFGSGDFVVNRYGNLTAKGGGTIAGWNITDTTLYKNKVGISSYYNNDSDIAIWAGSTSAKNAHFRVTYGGILYASSGVFSGSLSGADITGATGTFSGGINVNNKFIVNSNGDVTLPPSAKISWSQITDGNTMATQITENTLRTTSVVANNLIVKSANISGTINANQINAAGLRVNAANIDGQLTANQIDATWLRVNAANIDGQLTANQINTYGLVAENISATSLSSKTLYSCTLSSPSGNIGGWTINSSGLSSWYADLNPSYLSYGSNFYVDYSGTLTASNANISGHINATSGSIGDFSISNGELIGSGIRINYSQLWVNDIVKYDENRPLYISGCEILGTFEADGNVYFPGVFSNTTTADPNLHITSTGYLNTKSGSLRKYKHNIRNISNKEIDPHKLYDIPVREFIYNDDYLSKEDSRYQSIVPGFIVEELLETYPIVVDYDNGKPSDWNHRFLIPPILYLIQELKEKVDKIEKIIEGDKQYAKQ